MNSKKKINRIYLPILVTVLIISIAFRIAALLANFSADTGYFEKKGLIYTGSVILIAGAVLLFTYAFVGGKDHKLIASFSTPATYVPTGVISVALMFFAAATELKRRASGFSFESLLSGRNATAGMIFKTIINNLSSIVLAALVPLAILSVGYFVLNACVIERASTARAAFGIINVIFLASYASFLYFDTTLSINAPNKIVDQMAFVFSALFFLYEIRISLGRECWNLYMSFGFLAALTTGYSSIPSIVMYFAKGVTVSNSIYENVLTLCIFIFILSRVILAAFLREDKPSEFVSLMRDTARERDGFIKEKEEAERQKELELYRKLEALADAENESKAESEENEAQEEEAQIDHEAEAASEEFKGSIQMTYDELMGYTETPEENEEENFTEPVEDDEAPTVEDEDPRQERINFDTPLQYGERSETNDSAQNEAQEKRQNPEE